ncbi:MAG: DNA-binding domain-containing protein [Gammaproteobacteria bacterium]|nr:DNA-binding domain-containing protein [Gammaproteobacteria bacterium]
MSNSLNQLQNDFQDFLLGKSERVIEQVDGTNSVSATRRLDIYHNAYRLRLLDVLMDTYERVVPYIGGENFESAALAFIESHPPSARSVRDYGVKFPEFLADYFEKDLEVAELAAMDQRLRNTFDAADAESLGLEDVATLSPEAWENLKFELHPTTSFQEFSWNTPEIWQSLSNDEAPPLAQINSPVIWLFWRKDLQPHFRSMTQQEHVALQQIGQGYTFGKTCESLAHEFPELNVSSLIATWLQTWLYDGVLHKTFTR